MLLHRPQPVSITVHRSKDNCKHLPPRDSWRYQIPTPKLTIRYPNSQIFSLLTHQSPPTTLLSAGISIRRRRPAELSPLPSNPSSSVVRRLFLPVSSSLFSLLSSSDRQCCGAPSPPSFSTSRITMEPQTQGL
nr:uncharacterized protein LOC112800738 [Arachis hypogaea]